MSVTFTVAGVPAPQGSKRYLGNGVLVESSKRVKPWRADIRAAAERVCEEPLDGPLDVTLIFTMPRPRSHYRTGRNAHLLRDAAPRHPAGRPDVDKLARAVLDAIKGIAWNDDAQVVRLDAVKMYDRSQPGVTVEINEPQLEGGM